MNKVNSRWREITSLTLLCVFELFLFSSLTATLPIYLSVIIGACIVIPAIIFLSLAIKHKNPDKKDLKMLFIFIIIALLCGIARSYLFIISLLIAYLFYDNKEKMYKYLFLINTICLSVFIILSLISVIQDIPILRYNGDTLINVRHTFGFNHPNHALKFYLSVICWGYLWLCKNKKQTLLFSFIMLPFALLIGYNTGCRTGLATIIILLILMNLPFFTKLLKTKWLYLLFIDITIVIVIFHNNELLNNYLATRPSLFYLYLDQYTIYTLFGKCYVGMMNYPLDNGFLFTLFDGGIIALILICYTFYISFKNNEDTKIKIVLIAVLIYSLFECLSTIYANPIYILMFSELLEIYYKNKDKIKIIEDNKEKESIKKAKQKI